MGLEESLGIELRTLRRKRGLSQENLGFKAGLHRTYISMLENGRKSPTLNVIVRIAGALQVRASDIVAGAEKRASRGSRLEVNGRART
jgi:transcriptional regulator with XRE-family HTH domain